MSKESDERLAQYEAMEVDDDLSLLMDDLRAFEAVKSANANFGACDTEPEAIFHDVIRLAAQGLPYPEALDNADEWDLFVGMAGVLGAAAALTGTAKRVHATIRQMRDDGTARAWRKAQWYLKHYAWRVSWCECEG